jgi:hypothetical protein
MANKPVDFSTPIGELIGGDSAFFASGMYRCEESYFTMYDFGKGEKNMTLCLRQDLQPLDGNGDDSGEVVTRYWPLNATTRDGAVMVEPISPIKGRKGAWSQIVFTDENKHQKLYGRSDFSTFLKHAVTAEVDMDAVGNDITAFAGKAYEYGLFTLPTDAAADKTKIEEAEDGEDGGQSKRKFPKQVVVIVSTVKAKGKTAKKKPSSGDDEDDAPAKPTKSKKASGPEGLIAEYLESKVEDGDDHMDHKMRLVNWLVKVKGLDKTETKPVMVIFNDIEDALQPVLKAAGWKLNKAKEFVKLEED